MTNDTTTLNGALTELGELMADNLNSMGVSDADASDGLTTLANKILDIAPVSQSLTLTSDKSILSAYDSEYATLTATLSGGVVEGQTVSFDIVSEGSVVENIGTATTNSGGVATVSYYAEGTGDISIQASVGMIVSETYAVEDCWNTKLTEQTIECASSSKYSSIGLNEIHNIKNDNFVLEFDSKGNGTLSVGHSSYWESSTNYRATLGTADGKHYYSTRATSTSESYGGTYDSNTYYHYKLTREGSTIKFYVDDTLLGTKTTSFFSSYSTWCIYSIIWGANTTQYVKNVRIKPL